MELQQVKSETYYHLKWKYPARLIPWTDVYYVRDDSIVDLRTESSLIKSGRRPVLQEDTNQPQEKRN